MSKKIFILFTILCFLSCYRTVEHVDPNKAKSDTRKPARILFAGDVMLDWGIKEIIYTDGIDAPIKSLRDFLGNFDYRFCNLECPITKDGEIHPTKLYIFRGNPEHIDLLKFAGINGVSLANNHALDYGKTGLFNTIEYLNRNGINYTGAGMDMNSARLPVTAEINNIRFVILAYTNVAYDDTLATEDGPGVAMAHLNSIKNDIECFRSLCDFIIVSMHWGIEYSFYPAEADIILAHSIIDSGADVIIGHHPHIFQGVEIYKGKPIFYSLGNFIFGSINEKAKENILVEISFSKKRADSFRVFPINGNGDTENPFRYKIFNESHAKNSLNRLIIISRPLGSQFAENAKIKGSSLFYKLSGK